MKKMIGIVDDSKNFRASLKLVLQSINPELEIDESTNGEEFIKKLESTTYDMVFMDIDMPVMNGISATKYAVTHHHFITIIALTFHKDYKNTEEMIFAGAKTYLVKDEMNVEVLEEVLNKYSF